MTLFIAFVLPTAAFLFALRRGWLARGSRAALALLVAAFVTAAAVPWLVFRTSLWKEGTEIAWTGLATASDRTALAIGGPRETATVGWPNGAFWPRVELTPEGGDRVRLAVAGGGAAVETRDGVVNGVLVADGESKDVAGFTVGSRAGFLGLTRRLSVARNGEELVSFRLHRTASGVATLGPLLSAKVAELRARREPAASALALELEQWGAELRLSTRERHAVRLFTAEGRTDSRPGASAEVRLPARLEIRFPDLLLEVEVTRPAGRGLLARFLPPWRLACPIPPPLEGSKSEERVLTVTGEPLPGDRAFELPLGRGLPDPRARLRMLRGPGGRFEFEGAGPPRAPDPYGDAMPPGLQSVEEPESFRAAGMTSAVAVPAGRIALHVAVLEDLPSRARLFQILGIGLVLLALGLKGTRPDLGPDARSLLGLVSVLWSFAVLRLLLAFRYAIDPTGLDKTAMKGLATACAALVLLPAFFLVVTRLYRDGFVLFEGRAGFRRGYALLAYAAAVCGAAWAEAWLAPRVWPNLPPRLRPDTTWLLVLVSAVLAFLVFVQLLHTYVLDDAQRERFGWLSPLSFVRRLALRWGPGFWGVHEEEPRRFAAVAVLLLSILLGVLLAMRVLNGVLQERFFQEIASPFLVVGLPALFWISSKARWGPEAESETLPGHLQVLVFAVLFVLLPIVSPLVLGDTGGIFATLAFVLPMSLLLLVGAPRRFGGWSLAMALFAIALAATVLVGSAQLLPGFAVSKLERGLARYLVFKRGPDAQKLLPFAQVSTELGEGVSERSLQNTIEHTWENVSIAHWGRFLGLGFGKAPTRRSMVPLVPIESDSTFSFFVVSEHGLLGGASLLLLYAFPLGIVLASARRRFDVGHVIAAAVAASFLNEALVHAAMNLGALPFTGRNLPLLSVNSKTDLLRWLVLFGLVGQSLLWRRTGDESKEELSPAAGSVIAPDADPPEPRGRWGLAVAAASALSLVLFVGFWLVPAVRVARDPRLEAGFSWNGLLEFVQSMIDRGHIAWDASKGRITLASVPVKLQGETFLEQEIERFNSLPEAERVGQAHGLPRAFVEARSLAEYDAAMDALRTDSGAGRVRRRPSLFHIVTVADADDSDEADESDVVQANPAFDVHLTFAPDADPEDMPRVAYRPSGDGGRAGAGLLLGPAWVNGRYRAVVDRGASVPWAGYVADALRPELKRLGLANARRRYGNLTLDEGLQRAAMRFAAEKGRALHAQLLAGGRLSGLRRVLPPRVALAVLDLPSGEVLALGGWPRMTSSASWKRAGSEWVPPAAWLERDAPDALTALYAVDRNFDRIEMGSLSKPFWAAAVLDVHPEIGRLLATRGPLAPPPARGRDTHVENEVFGIPVPGRPWHAAPDREWCDFTRYLARSDNTYQVRLGFLGLAEREDGRIAADRAAGASASDQESFDRGRTEWRKYPRFPDELRFSPARPGQIAGLDRTPLAKSLGELFSIGVARGDVRPHRRSFWTLAEEDDRAPSTAALASPARPWTAAFGGISPQSVQLDLGRVSRPRDYVSRLVGGSENRWSNVDVAAQLAAAVTGHPVVAHVVPGRPSAGSWRRAFPEIAAKLRPGLAWVVAPGGTAYRPLQASGALALLLRAPDVKVYAKTGTISLDGGATSTSRLAAAFVRWKDEAKGEIASGVVVSVVVEKADQGVASEWLGQFVAANLRDRAPFR